MNPAQRHRVQALESCFATIANTRMKGVPVQNPALRVEAVGFELDSADAGDQVLLGILLTPWFMSLLRLPLVASGPDAALRGVGQKRDYVIGTERFEFISACEASVGAFESCSLFSPMFEFADHAAAVATAHEVLKLLRTHPKPAGGVPGPGRRGFLFGRGTSHSSTTGNSGVRA